ncbi:TraB/GumN family protein [Aliamphritea hakodatensis]|uniref:TraB/GumN family protein n=1 Tax=Aliamphritea hakodatensis TaxID=2895352 RepID=UPI0022FD5058|nr:TraB/GumN family protein [Aliamphritea hakodatensis]
MMRYSALLGFMASVVLASQSIYASPVWKVSDGKETVYLGGTVHVLEAGDYPLPATFDKAYRQADMVFFETDIDALSTQGFVQQLLAQTSYPQGQSIVSRLSAETLAKLKTYLVAQGISFKALEQFRPGMLGMQLSQIELRKQGISVAGVDSYFNDAAIRDNKPRGRLETPQDQIHVIATMGQGNESEVIENALTDVANLREDFNQIRDAWRRGDRSGLTDLTVKPFREELPADFKLMIVDRNNKWMPQIERMFRTAEDELVLVGAMHLVGREGLLQQLEKKGYSVVQMH